MQSKTIQTLVLAFVLVISSLTLLAAPKDDQNKILEENQSSLRLLKQDAKSAASDIEILRRDQINYRVEKDLLKEAYSSNLQSINIVLTIVFGVFAAFGYVGMRSIKDIKIDYATELENLRKLKNSFENELIALSKKQQEFETQVGDLTQTNQEQDRRLKVLELIEKINGFIQTRQWEWAMHYIDLALEMDSKNTILLIQKAMCLARIGKFDDALATRMELMTLEPNNIGHVSDVLEMLALTKQSDEFEKLYAQHKNGIDAMKDGNLSPYLSIILALVSMNFVEAKQILGKFTKDKPNEPRKYLSTWDYDDINSMISSLPEGRLQAAMAELVLFFQGTKTAEELNNLLDSEKIDLPLPTIEEPQQ